MKKSRLTIIVYSIIILILGMFIINIAPKAETTKSYQKGDLRCPQNSNIDCKEIKDENGNTIEVQITYKESSADGDIEIVKKVKKKEELGRYGVEFEVKGNDINQKQTSGPIYIVIVADRSATNSSKLKSMKKAIKAFSDKIYANGNTNIYLGLVAFAGKTTETKKDTSTIIRSLQNKPFTDEQIDGLNKDLGPKSHLGRGYAKALTAFNNAKVPSNAKKYILLYGDGQYWYDDHSKTTQTNVKDLSTQRQNLKNKKVKIYGIMFKNGSYNDTFSATSNTTYNWCKKNYKYGKCDEEVMGRITDKWYSEQSDLSKQFKNLAETIEKDAGVSGTTYDAELKDNIGDNFDLADGSNERYKNFDIGKLTETGKTYGPFEIEIDPYADPESEMKKGLEEGWHKTNENFTLTYTNSKGEKKTITVKDNPEVYWIPNSLNIKSCYGETQSDESRVEDTKDEYSYYSLVCSEGYTDSQNKFHTGFKVTINVANQEKMGTQQFNITSGLGFPTAINLSTNVVCKYTFDITKFTNDYNKINNDLNKAQAESKEYYSLYTKKSELDNILNYYVDNVSNTNNLENYKSRFIDQPAIMNINYNNNESDQITFVNKEITTSKIYCDPVKNSSVINGKKVENKTCYAEFAKSMQLPNTCLNMQTGDSESCIEDSSQLAGGNKYYTKLKQTGGIINISVPKAGYRNNLNFKLEKDDSNNDACIFSASNKDITFRQIDVADPFLKKYNQEVGKNYLNEKFDFEKIIKDDIWDQKYMYDYQMSKVNIANIKKDTDEDRSSSYLGRNCKFTDDNKYICEFTRNMQNEDTVDDQKWFFKADY